MSLEFARLKPQKSYEHVVAQIEEAICEGTIAPGQRLPSELKLKEMFDTSRGTVREALRVLEQKGLINVKTGVKGGAQVKEANTEAMADSMALLIRHKKISLDHLARFRELLEGHAAEEAARLAHAADLEVLEAIMGQIQALRGSGPDNWEDFNRLDADFHLALARIGGNPLVAANLETVHQNVHTYFQQYLPFSKALLEADIKDLEQILDAVVNGDAPLAGTLARQHVSRFSQLMADQMEKETGL